MIRPEGERRPRHGHARNNNQSPTYITWGCMVARSRYKNRDPKGKYINRGIGIEDPRWFKFPNFLADMGERPAGTLIERVDNSRGYCKDNCRWATPTEQSRNRRSTILNLESATEMARAILAGEPFPSIAKRFHCSISLPNEIKRGRLWKDAMQRAREEQPNAR